MQVIENFINMIKKNKEKLKSEEVLTMNSYYEEACKLEKRLAKDATLSPEKCEDYSKRVELLY